MSFLGSALGSLVGGLIGGGSQSSAANSAAQAQENLTQQQLQYLQQAGSQARGAINSMLPYTTGGSTAAGATKAHLPYLAPGQGAIFGGQEINSNPTSGSDLSTNYSSLLAPQQHTASLPQSSARTAPPLSSFTTPGGATIHYNPNAPGSVNSALTSALNLGGSPSGSLGAAPPSANASGSGGLSGTALARALMGMA
jgi:hypothetical protein